MHKRGFTLIELLVVISIISLLSSIVLASLNVARAKARDAVRLTDMRTIRTALELYYDNHRKYPDTVGTLTGPCGIGWGGGWEGGNSKVYGSGAPFINALVTDGDISKVPTESYWDASNVWTGCTYRYLRIGHGPDPDCPVSSTGNYAILYMHLEGAVPTSCQNGVGSAPACIMAEGHQAADPGGCIMILPE